jgi:hypothetical protein
VKGLVKGSSENGNAGDAADVALERHLREVLQARMRPGDRGPRSMSTAPASPGGAPGPACLDAETLAAWADGELGAHERAAAEAHAADCLRCQTLLAAMIRSAPPAAEVTSWWRLPAVKWLAPLAAVAAGLVVWAIVPNGRPSVLPGIQTASQPAIQPSLQSSRQFGVQPSDRVLPRASDTASATASAEGRLQESKARVPALRAPGGRGPGNVQEKQLGGVTNGAAAAPASSMPAPALSLDLEAGRSAAAQEQSAKAAAPPAGAGAPSAAAAAPPARAAATFVRPAAAAAAAAATESLARTRREDAVIGAVLEILSPDANSRWQIVPGGPGSPGSPRSPGSTVRRSTDGGSSWETQQTGAGVTLVAGGSPSSSVCWLVGPGGTVLLQTDGRSWRRIGFPERVDLTSVRAVNEKSAAVTAVDGRTFSTSDGGLTWTRAPIPD